MDPGEEIAPPPPPAEEPAVNTSAEPAVRRRPSRSAPRANLPALPGDQRGHGLWGWVSLAVFVVAIVGGAALFPRQLVDAWPPMKRLYDVVGINPAHPWLEAEKKKPAPAVAVEKRLKFRDLEPSQRFFDGVLTLVIKGKIENIGIAAERIPPVRVVLLDGGSKEIKSWVFEIESHSLHAGATTGFETRLENPPPEAQDIRITFVDGK